MDFADKAALFLLGLIPLLLLLRWFARPSSIRFPGVQVLREMQLRMLSPRTFAFACISVCLVLLVLALARPREGESIVRLDSEGVDIMLVLDISGSMRAEDFTVKNRRENRLYVAKDVTRTFVTRRMNDRMGMVVFAGKAYTQCPLTLDHPVLLDLMERVEIGQADDGTAIGSAIVTAVNRLKETEAKSKLIVLLTDGVNNAGKIDPMTAAEVAKKFGIKVYTIGVGTKGLAPYPVQDIFGNTVYKPVRIELDDETLHRIAQKTGAQYFRATDTEGLTRVYATIDAMEKETIESFQYTRYEERYRVFLLPALLMLLFFWLGTGIYFLEVP